MSMSGLRVLRGPDWRGGDTDGGEGHVGTVTELLGNHTVRVLWDMGQESTCSAGHDGTCELRVFDTAQIGVRHPGTRCTDCGDSDIWGMLWRCRDCTGCDLCPLCYSDDKHDLRHQFLRIDMPGTKGQIVSRRKTSVRYRSLGLFPGSKVSRGKDWQWGNQDGGQGSEGEVKGYENVSADSVRNLVRVEWPHGDVMTYRHGFYGYVDVMCVEEEVGPWYYRDHLPVLDTEQVTKLLLENDRESQSPESMTKSDVSNTSDDVESQSPEPMTKSYLGSTNGEVTSQSPKLMTKSDQGSTNDDAESQSPEPMTKSDVSSTNNDAESQNVDLVRGIEDVPATTFVALKEKYESDKTREKISSADGDALTPGARVAVRVGVEKLLQLQQQCGADTEDLKRVLGKTGHVIQRTAADSGSVLVKFQTDEVVINSKAIVPVQECKPGDRVRLRDNVDDVKVLNCRVGWKDGMDKTAGKVGQVLTVDSEGDLLVSFGRHHFMFAPACCTHVTSDTPVDSLDIDAAKRKARGDTKIGVGSIQIDNKRGESKKLLKKVEMTVDSGGCSPQTHSFAYSGGCSPQTHSFAYSGGRGPQTHRLGYSSDFAPARLFVAAQQGDHRTVREMCTANKHLVEYELQGLTPLMHACAHGHRQVVRVLLACGANANHYMAPFKSSLRAAIQGDDEDISLMLLEHGADPCYLDDKRHTYMHIAASLNKPRVLKALADRGVDVNARDDLKDTALHLAIENHCHDAVDVLLSTPGIDLNVRDMAGNPMLHHACTSGDARSVRLIVARDKSQVHVMLGPCRYSPLHHAVHDDHDDCVRLMVLEGGADVDQRYHHNSYTPLLLACARGMHRAAEALLELGANLQVRDDRGNTPLHLAVSGCRVEDNFGPQSDQEIQVRVALACLLVSNGALVDAGNFEGRGPLAAGDPAITVGVESFITENPKLVRRQGGV